MLPLGLKYVATEKKIDILIKKFRIIGRYMKYIEKSQIINIITVCKVMMAFLAVPEISQFFISASYIFFVWFLSYLVVIDRRCIVRFKIIFLFSDCLCSDILRYLSTDGRTDMCVNMNNGIRFGFLSRIYKGCAYDYTILLHPIRVTL